MEILSLCVTPEGLKGPDYSTNDSPAYTALGNKRVEHEFPKSHGVHKPTPATATRTLVPADVCSITMKTSPSAAR